jgi:hypothetical protein
VRFHDTQFWQGCISNTLHRTRRELHDRHAFFARVRGRSVLSVSIDNRRIGCFNPDIGISKRPFFCPGKGGARLLRLYGLGVLPTSWGFIMAAGFLLLYFIWNIEANNHNNPLYYFDVTTLDFEVHSA